MPQLPSFAECDWQRSLLVEGWPSLGVHHFESDGAYDAWQGRTLTPHYRHSLAPKYKNLKDDADPGLMYWLCRLPQPDGSTWHVQRAGPFRSRGGYDWWQMHARDAFSLSEPLQTQGTLYILEHFMGAVHVNGTGIGYPPLHPHHMHITPQQEFLRYDNPNRYSGVMFTEQHGDWVRCGPQQGDCRTQRESEGYGRFVDISLDMDMEMNDARAKNSPSFSWYLQLAARCVPGTAAVTPVSMVSTLVPGFLDRQKQSSLENYMHLPTHTQIVAWYSSAMAFQGGRLLEGKPHMHGSLIWRSYLFSATIEELGLERYFGSGDSLLGPDEPCMTRLDSTRFASFDLVHAELMRKAERHLVCLYQPTLVYHDGVAFEMDGQGPCKPWSFRMQQRFTSVSLLEYKRSAKLPPWMEAVPAQLPIHLTWMLTYVPEPSQPNSCYTGTWSEAHKPNRTYAVVYCTGSAFKLPVLRHVPGGELVVQRMKPGSEYWLACNPGHCFFEVEECKPPSMGLMGEMTSDFRRTKRLGGK